MKKVLLALSVFCAGFFCSQAQNIQIIDTTGTPSIAQPSYTISVDADSSNSILYWVKNASSSSINIQLKSYVISNVGGDLISYCIGTQCHTAGQPTLVNTPIAANGTLTSNGLLLDFTDFVGQGYSQVMYTLFNPSQTSDSTSIMVTYKVNATSIKQAVNNYNVSNISPNPASTSASINHDLKNTTQNASVKIYNMLGTLVKTVSLDSYSNNTKIDVASLEEGMYFYSVVVGGKAVKTSRLVVSR